MMVMSELELWTFATLFLVSLFRRRFPIDARCVGPKAFQVVQAACLGKKRMQHHVAVILQNPGASFVSFDSEWGILPRLHSLPDFLRQGTKLTRRCPGRDHEIVDDRRDLGQVEHDGIFAAKIVGNLSTAARIG